MKYIKPFLSFLNVALPIVIGVAIMYGVATDIHLAETKQLFYGLVATGCVVVGINNLFS